MTLCASFCIQTEINQNKLFPLPCSYNPHSWKRRFAQGKEHWVRDVIQPSHPLSSLSPPALNLFSASRSFPVVAQVTSGRNPYSEKLRNSYISIPGLLDGLNNINLIFIVLEIANLRLRCQRVDVWSQLTPYTVPSLGLLWVSVEKQWEKKRENMSKWENSLLTFLTRGLMPSWEHGRRCTIYPYLSLVFCWYFNKMIN